MNDKMTLPRSHKHPAMELGFEAGSLALKLLLLSVTRRCLNVSVKQHGGDRK